MPRAKTRSAGTTIEEGSPVVLQSFKTVDEAFPDYHVCLVPMRRKDESYEGDLVDQYEADDYIQLGTARDVMKKYRVRGMNNNHMVMGIPMAEHHRRQREHVAMTPYSGLSRGIHSIVDPGTGMVHEMSREEDVVYASNTLPPELPAEDGEESLTE